MPVAITVKMPYSVLDANFFVALKNIPGYPRLKRMQPADPWKELYGYPISREYQWLLDGRFLSPRLDPRRKAIETKTPE